MTSFPACSCVSPGMQRGEHARSTRENGDRPGKHRPRRGTTGRSRVRRCRPTDGFSIRSKVSGDSIGRQRFLEVANGWPQSAVGALVPQHRGTVSGTQSEKPLSGDPAAFRIRRIICSTNAIESLNARYRRAVRARGHFPNDAAALKCLYLVTRSLDPTGRGRARWVTRWKPALNAFAITFDGRIN